MVGDAQVGGGGGGPLRAAVDYAKAFRRSREAVCSGLRGV